MAYIPHTPDDIHKMLVTIGADSIEQLFDEIPVVLPKAIINQVPPRLNEAGITRLMEQREPKKWLSFIGAGAYEHHIPAAVWEIATRGEFYTAYTPYQAEASQGTLQLIYEYQTMMCDLMEMDVSNASLYDGASALAEGALMAVRLKRGKERRILVPTSVNPSYRQVLNSIVKQQKISVDTVSFDILRGIVDPQTLERIETKGVAALIISQPNFFGCLEAVDMLTDWAHAHNILIIASVNPTAMVLIKPPGQWGGEGVDIVCGEGQSLGIPLASGGPYFGFMCCRKEYVRQLPGRVIGRTTDSKGREGFTLTLQAREQHIRRSKATSNICTNQGLAVTASTIYLSLLGAKGLHEVALSAHTKARYLLSRLSALKGITPVFSSPIFHEFGVRLDKPVETIITKMAEQGIQAGYALRNDYAELSDCLLICVTETKTDEDLIHYEQVLKDIIISTEEEMQRLK
ncbi:aminomethyl-transferring glycine dehydrogenase subunit GcvPA [Coxiella endosymbiont of Amblyomma nuttalli]|uniref:aminomethyl-transferring glycine dehydrogenase subunit GcvPA n=1 Tax=Coxiella endosymbiont of Amblyomma nuttalli TaxID=2749996 RepID=UPI001BA7373E|nr:aminomethyl-transferring glycine dehydrogenase subunit GcvPA [Coxiella endosymbiont of Amblyomma nuttalli]QTS83731.1 putative glycine dehydrogenase (decarboxylating) subunit 1 [Coxiella endosymbiont of Amblyomma nuttalli]